MAKKKSNSIKWVAKMVEVSKIKPTPNNYKIKTDLGKKRLAHSLDKFGLAGTVIVSTDLFLIDGNSRLEEAKERGEKKIWVSMPDRKLTAKEYHEMSAMYDAAKAGEVDMKRIEQDLGTTEDFYKEWNFNVPTSVLEKLGANSKINVEELRYPENGKGASGKVEDICMVQLFFSVSQEKEFRKVEEKLMTKWKTKSTTETVLKAFKSLSK